MLHLDMDCFFAAVEELDEPALAGRPLVVGGTGPRGVVCSANYEARAFGVRSAMPTGEARSRCPHAVFLPPRHGRYSEVSRSIRQLLDEVTPFVEPVSLDEAYLEVSGARRLFGDGSSIAVALRDRIAEELSLACSVGVGRTKLVAKLASEAAKPRPGPPGAAPRPGAGVVVVAAGEELAFLHAHRVRALPGVGPATERALRRFGVSTVGDLAAVPLESLVRLVGSSHGTALHELALGVDRRPVVAERAARSIGHEETFATDLRRREDLVSCAGTMARRVARRLEEAGLAGRTLSLKLRHSDFSTRTRSSTLRRPEHSPQVLAALAVALAEEADLAGGIRLVGVQVSGLVQRDDSAPCQLELFAETGTATAAAGERAAEAVRSRFGEGAIVSAGAPHHGATAAVAALSRPRPLRDDEEPPGTGAGRSRG